jgi:predicted dehydrogenase
MEGGKKPRGRFVFNRALAFITQLTISCSLGLLTFCLFIPLACSAQSPRSPAPKPLRLAIAGLVHGHVSGFLRAATSRADVQIVGIFDPHAGLAAEYAKSNGLAGDILFTDIGAMLDRTKPQAVATFTSTFDHAMVVEACARRHIPVMMEKPLAVDVTQARAIQRAAERGDIPVIVNYETTWYKTHGEIWKLIKEQKAAGEVRRIVAMDGHQGPQEIRVQPEFLGWLIDPRQNGGGAMFDFGCYGANLMTWLMDNQRPVAVTAIARTNKPRLYPRVDDEATILVQYPHAQGVIQASWNWPFGRKDLEVYGENGYAIATGGEDLRVRLAGQRAEQVLKPGELPADQRDPITYLTGVARGEFKPSGLNSLENNVIVIEILEAARESSRTGRTIPLKAGPGRMNGNLR